MNSDPSFVTFAGLVNLHQRIRVPIIQRDYAQGWKDQKEVRDSFLGALKQALLRPLGHPLLPLNLDFVYGNVEEQDGVKAFQPLDGQQRLTTLFLLHGYLAWKDGRLADFQERFGTEAGASRFSYSVRASSKRFFDQLIQHWPQEPAEKLPSLKEWIQDQPWFFREWRFDPTIVSALGMLEALHQQFRGHSGLYDRLIDPDRPAITFQILNLKDFGLSDDLYLKMNARGKALTPFENFKARYEDLLKSQFQGKTRKIGTEAFEIHQFVARRMDTAWADLFWQHRDPQTNSYDSALMKMIHLVVIVSRDLRTESSVAHLKDLRDSSSPGSFASYESKGDLDEAFTETWISLLEAWCRTPGLSGCLLPDNAYHDEKQIFAKVVASGGVQPGLTLPQTLMFAGYAAFIRQHESAFNSQELQSWMRILRNLSEHSYIEGNDELRRTMLGMRQLLPHSAEILQHLAGLAELNGIQGFLGQQLEEERLKAQLILAHKDWWKLIDQAERHGYFNGQIGFLLDFSGIPQKAEATPVKDWDPQTHAEFQGRFSNYLGKAEAMFGPGGVKSMENRLWERALFAIGDYLMEARSNWCFPSQASTEPRSWKALLRGVGEFGESKREHIKTLWDRLDLAQPIQKQLEKVIRDAKPDWDWIRELVHCPAAWDYCAKNALRFEDSDGDDENMWNIYLLRTTQMNGRHAEFFTFCLYHQLNPPSSIDLTPLQVLGEYSEGMGNGNGDPEDARRYFVLCFDAGESQPEFWVEYWKGDFYLRIEYDQLSELPEVSEALTSQAGFQELDEYLQKTCPRSEILPTLQNLAQLLKPFTP